jgi:hypothetical protein
MGDDSAPDPSGDDRRLAEPPPPLSTPAARFEAGAPLLASLSNERQDNGRPHNDDREKPLGAVPATDGWRCVRRTAAQQSSFRKILSQTSRGGLGRAGSTPSRESDEVQRLPPPPPNGGPRRTGTLACAPTPSSKLEGPTPRASTSAPAIKSIHARRAYHGPKGPRGDITHPLQHFPACLLQHEQKKAAMRHSTSDSALVSGARGFDGWRQRSLPSLYVKPAAVVLRRLALFPEELLLHAVDLRMRSAFER